MQYTLDNIVGTHTLLECCKKYAMRMSPTGEYGQIKKIIHISTDEVYGFQQIHTQQQKLVPN